MYFVMLSFETACKNIYLKQVVSHITTLLNKYIFIAGRIFFIPFSNPSHNVSGRVYYYFFCFTRCATGNALWQTPFRSLSKEDLDVGGESNNSARDRNAHWVFQANRYQSRIRVVHHNSAFFSVLYVFKTNTRPTTAYGIVRSLWKYGRGVL